MNEIVLGIVDEPNQGGETDRLDLGRHAKALSEFIAKADTPITIGIQGEWGSGKTSLLNSIWNTISKDDCYKQIWINSWENSLLCSPEEALLKIIGEIIDHMINTDIDISKKEKIRSTASSLMRGAMRVGAAVTLGNKAADVAEELMRSDNNNIKKLRQQLADLSTEIRNRQSNSYKKIIIYVDDLDRIEPKDAVRILELLKNIFNIPGCIFILAIDYQVVVKGLEHKFGKRTQENEWEFRAFFDKIIQLPFMMPMGQYNIGLYVNDLLIRIGYIDHSINSDSLKNIVLWSIGGNPRSMKRLINSLALIDLFSKIDIDEDDNNLDRLCTESEKNLLLFTIVCIQIAYPDIYNILIRYPDFRQWDDIIAFEITQRKEEEDKEKFEQNLSDATNSGEDFDEEWERSLYRICYSLPRYKARVTQISRLLSYIKDELLKLHQDNFETIILELLGDTSVTTVSATDDQQIKVSAFKNYSAEKEEFWKTFQKQLLKSDAIALRTSKNTPPVAAQRWYCNVPVESISAQIWVFMNGDIQLLFHKTHFFNLEAKKQLFQFNELLKFKNKINAEFNGELIWQENEDKRRYLKHRPSSPIKASGLHDGQTMTDAANDLLSRLICFEKIIYPYLEKIPTFNQD